MKINKSKIDKAKIKCPSCGFKYNPSEEETIEKETEKAHKQYKFWEKWLHVQHRRVCEANKQCDIEVIKKARAAFEMTGDMAIEAFEIYKKSFDKYMLIKCKKDDEVTG